MRSGFTDLRSTLPMNFRLQRTGLTREAAVEEEIRRIMEIWGYPWIVEWGTAAEYEPPISRYDDI